MSADDRDTPNLPTAGPASGEALQSGRYIPYSGGSAGWFENGGVMKSELRNNYRFHQEMDLPEVRAKQFLRWGTGSDRRESDRKRRQLPVNVGIGGRNFAMTTWDMNERGVRLQYTDDLSLVQGTDVTIEVLDKAGGTARLVLDAQVIWVETAGSTRQVWSAGMFFPYVSPEDMETLKGILGDRPSGAP